MTPIYPEDKWDLDKVVDREPSGEASMWNHGYIASKPDFQWHTVSQEPIH